jgi:hypothetical protein
MEAKVKSIITEYRILNGTMKKLNTCRLFRCKPLGMWPLQRPRKAAEVTLHIKRISKKYSVRTANVSEH